MWKFSVNVGIGGVVLFGCIVVAQISSGRTATLWMSASAMILSALLALRARQKRKTE